MNIEVLGGIRTGASLGDKKSTFQYATQSAEDYSGKGIVATLSPQMGVLCSKRLRCLVGGLLGSGWQFPALCSCRRG